MSDLILTVIPHLSYHGSTLYPLGGGVVQCVAQNIVWISHTLLGFNAQPWIRTRQQKHFSFDLYLDNDYHVDFTYPSILLHIRVYIVLFLT